jgi:hypothetical protein
MQEEPELLGRVRNLPFGGRLGLEFLIKIKMNKEEVLER